MGSWNETCCVSTLPIQPGEPCRLIFTAPSNDGSGKIYTATSRAQPISLAIPVTYFDYGYVKRRGKSWEADLFTVWASENMELVYENRFGEPIEVDTKSVADVTEAIVDNDGITASIDYGGTQFFKVGFNLIREGIYQYLKDYDQKRYDGTTSIRDHLQDEIQADAKDVDKSIDQLGGPGNLKDGIEDMLMDRRVMSYTKHFAGHDIHLLPETLSYATDPRAIPDDFSEKIIDMIYLVMGMNALRATFGPTNGTGSQNIDAAFRESFLHCVLKENRTLIGKD